MSKQKTCSTYVPKGTFTNWKENVEVTPCCTASAVKPGCQGCDLQSNDLEDLLS